MPNLIPYQGTINGSQTIIVILDGFLIGEPPLSP